MNGQANIKTVGGFENRGSSLRPHLLMVEKTYAQFSFMERR